MTIACIHAYYGVRNPQYVKRSLALTASLHACTSRNKLLLLSVQTTDFVVKLSTSLKLERMWPRAGQDAKAGGADRLATSHRNGWETAAERRDLGALSALMGGGLGVGVED